jgi:hypothetical protein
MSHRQFEKFTSPQTDSPCRDTGLPHPPGWRPTQFGPCPSFDCRSGFREYYGHTPPPAPGWPQYSSTCGRTGPGPGDPSSPEHFTSALRAEDDECPSVPQITRPYDMIDSGVTWDSMVEACTKCKGADKSKCPKCANVPYCDTGQMLWQEPAPQEGSSDCICYANVGQGRSPQAVGGPGYWCVGTECCDLETGQHQQYTIGTGTTETCPGQIHGPNWSPP